MLPSAGARPTTQVHPWQATQPLVHQPRTGPAGHPDSGEPPPSHRSPGIHREVHSLWFISLGLVLLGIRIVGNLLLVTGVQVYIERSTASGSSASDWSFVVGNLVTGVQVYLACTWRLPAFIFVPDPQAGMCLTTVSLYLETACLIYLYLTLRLVCA